MRIYMYIQVPAKQKVCVETTAGTAVPHANVRPVYYSTVCLSVTTLAATSFVSVLHT